jgi:alkylhydroperoxidase family enzyme
MVLADSYHTLAAYVALGHWLPAGAALEPKLEMLVARMAAELSACQWCLAQTRHLWLRAFLPAALLTEVHEYETSPAFTERERAALGLAEAVARHTVRDRSAPDRALARARRHFAEPEVARLAAAAAGEHFFNPATGAIGLDAWQPVGAEGEMPWRAIDQGVAIRGLY